MRLLKFLSILIIVISLCLSLLGCGFLTDGLIKTEFSFLQESSEIKSIQIVIIGEITHTTDTSLESPKEVYTPKFDIVCDIQNVEQFTDDFSKIDCYVSSPPHSPTLGNTGIKITYENGDYDVICSDGQGEYRDGFYYADSGKVYFDETQFNELLSNYITNTK